jgi:hypothetical protein
MQPHNVENPRPDPGNDPKRKRMFWLLAIIVALLAAISVNLLDRL